MKPTYLKRLQQLVTAAQQAIFSKVSQQKEIVLFTISGEEEQECSLDIYDEVPDFPFYGKQGFIDNAAIRVLRLQENTVCISGILKGDAYPQQVGIVLQELDAYSSLALADHLATLH
jgi:hypothetical protein